MAGPCLNDTESVTLNRDTSGNIEADLLRNGGDASGIEVTPTGVRINEQSGVIRTSGGLAVARPLARSGWVPGGTTGDQFPGTAVGAGAVVQIGATWSLGLVRSAPLAMYAELQYGVTVQMTADDIFTVNPFQGWIVELQRRINRTSGTPTTGAWVLVDDQGITGTSTGRHALKGLEDVLFNDGETYLLECRVVARGGLVETVICNYIGKRFARVRWG
jgi:hypothetical protein